MWEYYNGYKDAMWNLRHNGLAYALGAIADRPRDHYVVGYNRGLMAAL